MNERVESALANVRHPSRGTSLLEAAFLEDVRVEDDRVVVVVDESALTPNMEAGLSDAISRAATSVEGIENVSIERVQPGEKATNVGFSSVETVLAVASAKGGVGKSTVAFQLACALADDNAVGLFDADVYDPNVAAMLDVEGPVRTDDRGFPMPIGVNDLETMSIGYLHDDTPLAWRGSVAHSALTELLSETAWNDREILVLDLPPGTGDSVLTVLQEAPIDGVVVVTTPADTSVTDTNRSIDLFEQYGVPVVGVVKNMVRYECDCCGTTQSLFSDDTSREFSVPVLAEIPFDPDLQSPPTPGSTPEASVALAEETLDRLQEVSLMDVPPDAVDIRGLTPEARYDPVRTAFEELEPGDQFYLKSDRDPTPVRKYLAELSGTSPDAFDVTVERHDPDEWVLQTTCPKGRVRNE